MAGTTSVVSQMESNNTSALSLYNLDRRQNKETTLKLGSQKCRDLNISDVSSTWWPCPPTTDIYNASNVDASTEGNKYISPLFHPSSYERGFNTSAYVGIFLCTFGIFLNLLLFASLLSSRRLRFQFLYIQILNIALADLSYIVTVDSFTVYFELQAWRLGTAFCKTWMILDVVLPSVALFALLLLNFDRIAFAYKTNLYQQLMQKKIFRNIVILCPWCTNCFIVNVLWLGFPAEAEEQLPGACVYGITKEANVASIWLTVFIPSLLIFILLIFIFIAGIGEMPSVGHMTSSQYTTGNSTTMSLPTHPVIKVNEEEVEYGSTLQRRTRSSVTASMTSISHAGRQRRFVAALLAVDFISLAITLPYSAYSQVNISCTSPQTCQSFVSLFQILSWMKSSITCVRPVFFIFLTDIYLSLKRRCTGYFMGRGHTNDMLRDANQQRQRGSLVACSQRSYENITLTQINFRSLYSRNSSTTSTGMTPPHSPGQSKALLDNQTRRDDTTNVFYKDENNGTFV